MTSNEIASNPPELSQLGQMLEQVTIRSIDDVHDAAVALNGIAREREYRVALSDDIASNEPMVDADGGILNAEIFGWMDDGERWWVMQIYWLGESNELPLPQKYLPNK